MTTGTGVIESPVDRVLAALDGGASSRRAIAADAGLSEDLASAIVDQLVRVGQLRREALSFGCPPKGCGDCAAADPISAKCGTGRSHENQPTLVVLSRRAPMINPPGAVLTRS